MSWRYIASSSAVQGIRLRVCFCFINSKFWDTDDRIILTSGLVVLGDILGSLGGLMRGLESGGEDSPGFTFCEELEIGDGVSLDRLGI